MGGKLVLRLIQSLRNFIAARMGSLLSAQDGENDEYKEFNATRLLAVFDFNRFSPYHFRNIATAASTQGQIVSTAGSSKFPTSFAVKPTSNMEFSMEHSVRLVLFHCSVVFTITHCRHVFIALALTPCQSRLSPSLPD